MHGDRDEWLQERLRYWQEVLRLEDWRIVARFAPYHEFSDHGDEHDHAQVCTDLPHKHAFIKIKRAEERSPLSDGFASLSEADPLIEDVEASLVHELLHVSSAELDACVPSEVDKPVSLYRVGLERHVIALSFALVTLDRKRDPLPRDEDREPAPDEAPRPPWGQICTTGNPASSDGPQASVIPLKDADDTGG